MSSEDNTITIRDLTDTELETEFTALLNKIMRTPFDKATRADIKILNLET